MQSSLAWPANCESNVARTCILYLCDPQIEQGLLHGLSVQSADQAWIRALSSAIHRLSVSMVYT